MQQQLLKKEAMSLKERYMVYMERCRGRKGKGELLKLCSTIKNKQNKTFSGKIPF